MLAVLAMRPRFLAVPALIHLLKPNVPLITQKMLELSASVCHKFLNSCIMITSLICNIAIYPVRLTNGTESSGRVELSFNGRWGTVCDDNFDKLDGQVVCRQLNQGSISRIANPTEFPVGTSDQPIWLDEVQCTGNERWLSACPHPGYGTHDCLHSEDVGIVCTGK